MQPNNEGWIKIAEYISLAGSVAGLVAALVLGRLSYAAVVLFLSAWLNLVYRHRLHLITQQRLSNAITEVDQSIDEFQVAIANRVGELSEEISHLNENLLDKPEKEQIERLLSPILNLEQQLMVLDAALAQISKHLEPPIEELRDTLTATEADSPEKATTVGSSRLPEEIAQLSEQISHLGEAIEKLEPRREGSEIVPVPPQMPIVPNVWGVPAVSEANPNLPMIDASPVSYASATSPTPLPTWGNPYDKLNPETGSPQAFPANQALTVSSQPAIAYSGYPNPAIGGEPASNIDLRGAILIGCSLTQANFAGGDLQEANLSQADLRGADLREANLAGANLSGANLNEADLDGANLAGADLRGVNLRNTLFRNVYLSGANLSGSDLSGLDLSALNLNSATLMETNLSSANLQQTQLIGANLAGANLAGANLESANLTHANLTNANLIGANFGEGENQAQLDGAILPDGSIYE
ncbi:pentapeptide repeat-containing protein [Laspinema sp. A4]|uniref:pentapeptide repeat-containing protein n=1 Tax=Laspinema sp. D2d TaxID=2953686 RepID=UPI0021BAEBB7|nr:pentapeptide repeat-containing protein [Laspinema sp. D2d]MCT7982442.1 pentapeptide repeat-containing protein [Laspinema sp. D2d]